ncbi:MAG: rhodanese-like domain-containing protein [Bacteroidota bacterium]
MKKLIIILIVLGVVYAVYKIYQQKNIDSNLRELIAQGAIILDVRTKGEFENGHIQNAVNISLGEIRERFIELDTSKTYITYCSHGLRSIKVKNLLKEKGFRSVYNGGSQEDLEAILKEIK